MKPRLDISKFTAALLVGLAVLMFVVWCISMAVLVERQNRQNSETFQKNWQAQVLQMQHNQDLWLLSQFHQLNASIESPRQTDQIQSVVGEFYRKNPEVWAVSLVEFDDSGKALSRALKPGCQQPQYMVREDFLGSTAPALSSCRLDDRVLLEVAGPVGSGKDMAILLISMDFFSFVNGNSGLFQRDLQRSTSASGIQFEEFKPLGGNFEPVEISLGDASEEYGQLFLYNQQYSFWELFGLQMLLVLTLLLAASLVVYLLIEYRLLKPLQTLAEQMRETASNHQIDDDAPVKPVEPGLKVMHHYLEVLRKLARRDPVTGLNSRVIFEDRLSQAIRESKRNARKYALVLVEIYGLDEIAQQRGQFTVDALLKRVAENIREGLRETDNLARFERNLFALLLSTTDRAQLNALIEKIYLSITRRCQVHAREYSLSAGIGVSVYPDHSIDSEGLYQKASEALVQSEHSEWPIVYSLDEDENTDTSGFSLIQSLRRAIDQHQLMLVYQPVVDLNSHETVYLEALLRWKDPQQHEISIERTIQLAEQNQLIKPLTNWIFETACRFIQDCGVYNISIGINLSMIDLHDRQLPRRLESFLKKYQVRPSQIVIEITEGQIMQDPGEVIDVLAHLGVMGLSLSIDDFGTGQASLTYLKELPVEKLKIDQSFVSDIATNEDDRLIVKATIELAHTLDLKVVAEGVETLEAYEMLQDMNCDYVQGYYVSHPLESDQVSGWT
ncbi:MAG: bifunctional diguanylate cyclase/phosphodiesterase, partial [Pseudomonadota bacterium]